MASTAKEDMGQSSRSRPPQAAPPEAEEDSQCPICLGRTRGPAYVTYCMHKFCLKCIWLWSRARDNCPVCRQPIHRMLYSVQGDREYRECTIGLAARLQRRMAREGGLPPVSAAVLRRMQALQDQHLYGRSRPTDTERAQRREAALGPSNALSQQAPGPSNTLSQQAPTALHEMAPLRESEGPAGPAAPLEPQNGTE